MSDYSLNGMKAIITGANRGLGLATACGYLAAGADVAMGARDLELLQREVEILRAKFPQRVIKCRRLDVASKNDSQEFTRWALQELEHVDILVNNAGIYGPLGNIEDVDWQAWSDAISINLLGSVLMTRAVIPHMRSRKTGAIIQLSGGGATKPLPGISSYAASKAAIVRFAETLSEELKKDGISVNSIAPGALNTQMLDEILAAGPEAVGDTYYQKSIVQRDKGGDPVDSAVELMVFLGSKPGRCITGKLISAVWDRWHDWVDHYDDLTSSDVYTLRRIVGRERGFAWGDV